MKLGAKDLLNADVADCCRRKPDFLVIFMNFIIVDTEKKYILWTLLREKGGS